MTSLPPQSVIPAIILIDSGILGEAAIEKIEAETPKLQIFAVIERQPYGRTIQQLETHPETPRAEAGFTQKMKHRMFDRALLLGGRREYQDLE